MSGGQVVRLVANGAASASAPAKGVDLWAWVQAAQGPREEVFRHWVWMTGRSSSRCMLGPTRIRVIDRALDMGYPVALLLLAIDGCAASAWHAGRNDRGTAYDDLELILRDEQRIERFAQLGEQMAARAEREAEQQRAQAAADAQPRTGPSDDVRQRMAEIRRQAAARAAGRVLK